MSRVICSASLALFLGLLSYSTLGAQQTDVQKADSLHALAMKLQENPKKLTQAARLFEREAKLRGDQDPHTVVCLTTAAHLMYYGGMHVEGRYLAEQAAGKALKQRNVAEAANLYLLAATMAYHDDRPEAHRLVHEALLLSERPELSAEQRHELKERLKDWQT